MLSNLLLNPKEFKIDEQNEDGWKGTRYCRRLIKKWTSQLETEMLEAFIRFYYDEMYKQWGPDDEEESKKYWPEIELPTDLLKHTGTDVTLYALKDGVYARTKTGEPPYEPQNIAACVILVLDCPWEEEHGWAAVFIDEKFVKVDRGIDGCVWLDCMIE